MKTLAKILRMAFSITLGLCMVSCGGKKETPHVEDQHQTSDATSVSLSDEQMRAVGIQLGRVEMKQLTRTVRGNGLLRVPNNSRASVSAMMGGTISTLNVREGSTVRKGQTICTIINPEFVRMQEDFLTTKSKLEFGELELQRQKEMESGQATSKRSFQQSQSEVQILKTRMASLAKQLSLLDIDASKLSTETLRTEVAIVSPIAGTLSRVWVNLGTHVEPQQSIVEVVDNSQLHLDLFLYEKDISRVQVGQTIHFTQTNSPGREYDAEVFGISNTFESESKAIAVHALVKGEKSGLIDGMNITALISLDSATVPAIPVEAIVNHQGIDFVYVLESAKDEEANHNHDHLDSHDHHDSHGDEKRFTRVPVKRGTTAVGYCEITFLSVVASDAQIATSGAFFLLAKQTNTGSHEH